MKTGRSVLVLLGAALASGVAGGGEGKDLKIDPGKQPRHIDITFGDGTAPGIYAFEGGKLRICVADGGKRPTEFRSTVGSSGILFVLRRAKK